MLVNNDIVTLVNDSGNIKYYKINRKRKIHVFLFTKVQHGEWQHNFHGGSSKCPA